MGDMRFGAHDVAGIRFAISPLWETLASFRAADDPGRHTVHLPWIKEALRLRQDRTLTARTAPLRDDPALLTPPPRCPLAEIEEELALMGAGTGPAEAVLAWWEAAVRPYWARIRAVLEADIAYRTRQLAEDGIQEVFARLHPRLRWEGDRLVSPDLPPDGHDLDGAGLTLAPSAFAARCHLLTGYGAAQPAVVYPARAVGTLWERRDLDGNGLARLVGRSRARLLAETRTPSTTTQLAARTGLSLGAVSQHLSVLREAGLVTGHRYRREVNYTVSDLGAALLER